MADSHEKLIRFLHQGLNQEYDLSNWGSGEEGHDSSYCRYWSFLTRCGTVRITLNEYGKLSIAVELSATKDRESTFYLVDDAYSPESLLNEVRAELKLLLGTKSLHRRQS